MKNALFLDIDGVLNSNIWNDNHKREISEGTLIDEEKVRLLARLVKASEILAWIKLQNDVVKWVVLDDLDLHNAQVEQHQVKPDPTIGLTEADVEKAVKILLE